jgi:hypothetical protein
MRSRTLTWLRVLHVVVAVALFGGSLAVGIGVASPTAAMAAKKKPKPKVTKWKVKRKKPPKGTIAQGGLCSTCVNIIDTGHPEWSCWFDEGGGGDGCSGQCTQTRSLDGTVTSTECTCSTYGSCYFDPWGPGGSQGGDPGY